MNIKKLLLPLLVIAVVLSPLFFSDALAVALPTGTAVFDTSLASPITSSATSMTLSANSIRGGGSLSGYNCFTVDEGSTQAETICGSVSGTTVSSLTRGISQANGTTTVSALQFSHRRGANIKISDYPLIQLLKAILNGEDTIPNVLHYNASTGPCVYNDDICKKSYIDSVASAGASDANETTKGIVELSTTAEAAAGTSAGATGARLVPPNSMFSATPGAAIMVPVTSALGKLAQGFWDLTQSFTWTGNHAFNSGTTTFGGISPKVGIGTTSPYAALSVAGDLVSTRIFATSTGATATSSISGNLQIGNNATTTNLTVSGRCTGCANGYEVITNTTSISASATVSQTATCTTGKVVIGGGSSGLTNAGSGWNGYNSSPNNTTGWTVSVVTGSGASGTLTVYAICVNP